MNNKGKLIVFSSPSGCGKDTVLRELLKRTDNVKLSISSITRAMREGEVPGEKYNFISVEEFEALLANDGFLEHNIYCGNYYGTPKEPVERWMSQGYNVILEIDVNGAMKVKEKCPEAVLVFMLPPSFITLKQRLESRGTEDKETIEKRLRQAVNELKLANKYDYIFVNDNLDKAVDDLYCIIRSCCLTESNMDKFLQGVMKDAESFNR